MAGAGARIDVARSLHQEQMRRRSNLEELRCHGSPLSARVRKKPRQSLLLTWILIEINITYSIYAMYPCRFLASLVTVFGEFDISGELEAKRSVTKNVKRVLVHREYDAATFENDLALLELESPIHYDTHIGK